MGLESAATSRSHSFSSAYLKNPEVSWTWNRSEGRRFGWLIERSFICGHINNGDNSSLGNWDDTT